MGAQAKFGGLGAHAHCPLPTLATSYLGESTWLTVTVHTGGEEAAFVEKCPKILLFLWQKETGMHTSTHTYTQILPKPAPTYHYPPPKSS